MVSMLRAWYSRSRAASVSALPTKAPPTPASTAPRTAHTLVVVLDRSGSMSGPRLHAAKSALVALIDRLEPTDQLGVDVEFLVQHAVLSFAAEHPTVIAHTDVWRHPILSKHVPPHILQPNNVRRTQAPDEDYVDAKSAAQAKKLFDRGVVVTIGAHGQEEALAIDGLDDPGIGRLALQGRIGKLDVGQDAVRHAQIAPGQFALGLDIDHGLLGLKGQALVEGQGAGQGIGVQAAVQAFGVLGEG